jgi:hypothetical protein
LRIQVFYFLQTFQILSKRAAQVVRTYKSTETIFQCVQPIDEDIAGMVAHVHVMCIVLWMDIYHIKQSIILDAYM